LSQVVDNAFPHIYSLNKVSFNFLWFFYNDLWFN